MFDLIGDIHGHADELIELLELLGYENEHGVYQHPTRTAVFVGDFIDRGPQIREVLELVRPMCESGIALAVMGNHEFNALAYHTPDPANPADYLREHSKKNMNQHAATLDQVPGHELQDYLEWFRQLPMWLELDGLRIVHACWDAEQMSVIETAQKRYDGVSTDFLCEATTNGSPLYQAIEDVLKGKEMNLSEGVFYFDKDGNKRTAMRVKWFRAPEGETFASYALTADDDLPTDRLPESALASVTPYSGDAAPVFFGHYWLRADRPTRLAANVACLDFSVAKGGSLCAYRWDGERELDDEKFAAVDARDRPATR
jgi:hypothetical protein